MNYTYKYAYLFTLIVHGTDTLKSRLNVFCSAF